MRTLRGPSSLRLPNGIAGIQVQIIRESPMPYGDRSALPLEFPLVDDPGKMAEVFRSVVGGMPDWSWEREGFLVFHITTRRRVMAWTLVATGTLDSVVIHARDIFREAIVANSSSIVLAHNHPSGDPTPSESDVRVTRDLIRAGQLIRIDVLDHVIVGNPQMAAPNGRGYSSLRELGYWY